MAGRGPVDEYVAALRAALSGPGRAKRDLLAEVRDGLSDAAEAYESAGCARVEAERRAVADFGPVREIAPAFQQELALGQGRRTALLLFLGLPLITLMWSLTWRMFPAPPGLVDTRPSWFGVLARVMDCSQLLTGALGAAALLALGRGLRRLRRPVLIIRALGLFVWLQMPPLVMMSMVLAVTRGPWDLAFYRPAVAAAALTYALWVCQLYSATRCLRFSSPALTTADPAPPRSSA